MVSICHYESPLGGVLLAADEIGLTGLWFDGQKYFARGLPADRVERETPALLEAKRWLDIYFSGKEPDFTPPLHPIGSAFRQSVWVWGDRIFEKCGIRRDEEGDGGKTLEIRGKRRLSARDGGANYQQS